MTEVPEDDLWLTETECTVLKGLHFPKRRAEWRLGRWTAKRLIRNYLKKCKEPLPAKIEICAAEDGAPEIFFDTRPAQMTLSITHAGQLSAMTGRPASLA